MVRFSGWDCYGIPLNNCGFTTREPCQNGGLDPTAATAVNRRGIAYDAVIGLIGRILDRKRVDHRDEEQLLDWSVNYSIDPDEWPAGAIAHRLTGICGGEAISAAEAEDLKRLLDDIAGDPGPSVAEPAAIPFTAPPPIVTFANKQFVFAGRFVSGIDACIENIWLRGGTAAETVTARTDFLVIGALRSQEWVINSAGLEVEAALTARQATAPVEIISEESYLRAISNCRITHAENPGPATGPMKPELNEGAEHRSMQFSASPARAGENRPPL